MKIQGRNFIFAQSQNFRSSSTKASFKIQEMIQIQDFQKNFRRLGFNMWWNSEKFTLDADPLKEQWGLIRKASELGNLQDMKEVKEKFVQRFHWQHAAVKGMLRFMDDLQHYQTFNKDASGEKADSDVSSKHFQDVNMGTLIQSMRPSVQDEK
jgi:hypothetical protein